MRHAKSRYKLGKRSAHKRSMLANMLKSLIMKGRIETTVAKAKVLKRYADRMITLAKGNSLAHRRRAISGLKVRYNHLTSKENRKVKAGDTSSYNEDRKVIKKLFEELKEQSSSRTGGYTRIIKKDFRVGDSAPMCYIEYVK